MGKYKPIKHFTDIEAHRLGRELRRYIYKLISKLPKEEQYNLSQQMRRASNSITANIAEGYGRYHYQENIQFCRQSRGSMYEMEDHLVSCLDLSYINRKEYEKGRDICENAIRALNGYIRMLNKQKNNLWKANNVDTNAGGEEEV